MLTSQDKRGCGKKSTTETEPNWVSPFAVSSCETEKAATQELSSAVIIDDFDMAE
jgi:hypothetical protein